MVEGSEPIEMVTAGLEGIFQEESSIFDTTPIRCSAIIRLLYAGSETRELSCALSGLQADRFDVDEVNIIEALKLFRELHSGLSTTIKPSLIELKVAGNCFSLPHNVALFGFFGSTCSITFSVPDEDR